MAYSILPSATGIMLFFGLWCSSLAACLAADARPPATDSNLPVDFRGQVLQLLRQQSPDYSINGVQYSDPVTVLASELPNSGSRVAMSAVVFNYGPANKATGAPYLMIVQGAALFRQGKLLRLASTKGKEIEWTDGIPSTQPDSPSERSKMKAIRLSSSERLFDPVTGPTERRLVRRQIWNKYGPAFVTLKLPPETIAQLVDRLEDVAEARQKAQHAASSRGVDPFSAEMNREIEAENTAAHQHLQALLGKAQTDRLEYLASAPGYFRVVMGNGFDARFDLEDAGMPLTQDQIDAIGRICEDVCDPKRNPNYRALQKQPRSPGTQISATWQEVLSRLTPLLTPEQIKIIALNLADRASLGRNDSGAQPRFARRRMLRDYGAALVELNLSAQVIAQAKAFLIQRSEAPTALFAAARERGEDPHSDQSRAAQKASADAATDELKTLLGTDRYKKLEELHDTLPVRRSVAMNEATDCRAAGCPLTPDQVDRLAKVSWSVRKSLPSGGAGAIHEEVNPTTGLTARTAAILTQSTSFLSAAQLGTLEVFYQDQAAIMNRIAAEQALHAGN